MSRAERIGALVAALAEVSPESLPHLEEVLASLVALARQRRREDEDDEVLFFCECGAV